MSVAAPRERSEGLVALPAPGARAAPPSPVVVVLALVALGLTITGAARSAAHGFSLEDGLRVATVAMWILTASVLVRRRPAEPFGVLVMAGSAVAGVGMLSRGVLSAGPDDLAYLGCALTQGLLPALVFHAATTLPDGRLRSVRLRYAVIGGYAVGVTFAAVMFAARPSLAIWPFAVWAGGVAVAGGVVSNRHYLVASAAHRQRMQWVALGIAVVVEIAIVVGALRLFVGGPRRGGEVILAASLLIPASLMVTTSARLASRADRILTATVSIAALTAVVVVVFAVIVLGLGRTPTENERSLLALSMFASAVAAALWLPARERINPLANRLVYGQRESPEIALRTWGSRLSRAIPMDELLLQLAESLHKVLGLRSAEVWTGAHGRLERAASVPDRGPAEIVLSTKEEPVVARAGVCGSGWVQVWLPQLLVGREEAIMRVVPVINSGHLLGLVVVERAADREQFGEPDDEVLTELGRQVGLALHNVQLDSALQASLDEVRRQADELQASRARIVAAGDAERRKIERNLHDGAQQHLVALAVKLRLAKELTEDDPQEAGLMLEQLGADIKETLQELRNLAHGIYPPLLMDSGIASALGAAAGRAVLPAVVEASGLGRYSPEIEAAVYFCCLEAMQNAGKHAGADAELVLGVHEESGALVFEVADTGVGFEPSSAGGGAGFVNMRDRVGAIGGTVRVESSPGRGTRVVGTVPLGP